MLDHDRQPDDEQEYDAGEWSRPYDEPLWPEQTSGSSRLPNRRLLWIMFAFIIVGAILIGGPTVLSFFPHGK